MKVYGFCHSVASTCEWLLKISLFVHTHSPTHAHKRRQSTHAHAHTDAQSNILLTAPSILIIKYWGCDDNPVQCHYTQNVIFKKGSSKNTSSRIASYWIISPLAHYTNLMILCAHGKFWGSYILQKESLKDFCWPLLKGILHKTTIIIIKQLGTAGHPQKALTCKLCLPITKGTY